jgi:hypothetical protein
MKIRYWLARHQLAVESGLIFLICTVVYLANNITKGGTKDSVPHSLLVLNWIFNHQLNFDNFRDNYFFNGTPPWFFTESFTGHLTSAYPIGVALVTFPLYLIFAAVLWLNNVTNGSLLGLELVPLDITSATFEPTRLLFEKLAATLVTAAAVTIFYLAANLKFKKSICLLVTFIYAFATSNWSISSQALWQHTASNLVVVGILFCLLKANRTIGNTRRILLLAAGILAGLIFGIRPTNAVFSMAAIVYALFTYKKEAIFLGLGLSSASLSMAWNFYYFETLLTGGYANQSAIYSFSLQQFLTAFLGLLVSPSRGLLVFSPVLAFAFPGAVQIFKHRTKPDEKLLLCLTFASVLLFLNYCFVSIWWAGWCYGPRFLTDTLPILCFLIGYPLTHLIQKISWARRRLFNAGVICFFAALLISTSVQAVGALTLNKVGWDLIPIATDMKASAGSGRLWQVRDNIIERSAKSWFSQLAPSHITAVAAQEFNGEIEQIRLVDGDPLPASIVGVVRQSLLLQVNLKNTGRAEWMGYQAGIYHNRLVTLQGAFYQENGDPVKDGGRFTLFVADAPRPGDQAQALGQVILPAEMGTYRLGLTLNLPGGDRSRAQPTYMVPVQITPEQQTFLQDFPQARVPKTMVAGQITKIFAVVQTHSNFAWLKPNKVKNPVNFSYHWLNAQGEMVVFEGERTALPWGLFYDRNSVYDFGANTTAGLQAKIKAPDRPGDYILRLTMVQEGVAWFDAKGAKTKDIPVTITAS